MLSIATKCPVVLIHGVIGYGKHRPLWNSWSPYWPGGALNGMNQNHLMVDVGALSSDHDRACEAFYQLYGGRVDYGEEHSHEAGHNQFGATYENPLHPKWSASNPVHLIGHSFGGTTALELYQLVCSDFFGVGSDHRWVVGLVSIAGPLTGSTVTHLFGLHELRMVPYSLGHFIGAALGVWFKLHTEWTVLRQVFDFRMPQWRSVKTFREILSAYGRINSSTDLAVFNILRRERMKRNARLIHMDKIFLVSVATSSHVTIPHVEIGLTVLVINFAAAAALGVSIGHTVLTTLSIVALLVCLSVLWWRVRSLDYASIPSLYALLLVMRRHVRTLHMIFDGFDRELWGENDGAVNLHSMLQPWASVMETNSVKVSTADSDSESTASTSSSLSLEASELTQAPVDLYLKDELNASGDIKNLTQRILLTSPDSDAETGTFTTSRRITWLGHFDSDAPELFQRLFRVMANHFETAPTLSP